MPSLIRRHRSIFVDRTIQFAQDNLAIDRLLKLSSRVDAVHRNHNCLTEDVLLQLGDTSVPAKRLQFGDGATSFVQRIERSLAQAMRAEISNASVVAPNRLQACRHAPVSELVAERCG